MALFRRKMALFRQSENIIVFYG